MNRPLFVSLFCLVIALTAPSALAQSPVFGPNWIEHSKQAGVLLVQPDDFDFVPVVENPVMTYDLALRHTSGQVEARWSVQPVAEGEITSPSVYMTALLANISDAVGAPLQEFATEDVKRDYRAEWGALTVIKPKAALGGEFGQAVLVGLYRSGKAMVYGIFLCKDLETDMPVLEQAFSAMKFREPVE